MTDPLELSPTLRLPLDAVTRTFGIFGQRGSGKSTTAAVFVEQLVGHGGRALVFDPTGVWWGLTREGAGPGVSGVVLGGEHSDAPLEPGSGALVAEFIIGSSYPLVVLDMKLLRKHERQKLAMECLEALYHDNRDPLMVVIDESPQFAPQMMRGRGEDAVVPRLLGAVEDVVSLGRSRGLGATLIAQRLAMVNTNVREQVETLISHRLMGTNDRKALKGWIEAQADPEREAEVMASIAKLPNGSALVWSPAFLDFFGVVAMNNATTFDSRATPKVGERVKKPGRRTPVDLDQLRSRMAETIERAKDNDPGTLRKRIRELEQQRERAVGAIEGPLREKIAQLERELAARAPEQVEVPILEPATVEGLQGAARVLRDVAAAVGEHADAVTRALAEHRTTPARPEPRREPTRPSPPTPAPPPAPRPVPAAQQRSATAVAVSGPQQRILDALAALELIGVATPARTQVALFAQASPKSSAFANNLGALRNEKGTYDWPPLIDYPPGSRVCLTSEGRAVARGDAAPVTIAELHAYVAKLVGGAKWRLLEQLIAAYPDALSKQELADRAGASSTSSAFANNLGSLRSLGLIDYPQGGYVVALPVLFMEGA